MEKTMLFDHTSVKETVEFLKASVPERPTIGFFSGTGLNAAAAFLKPDHQFDYQTIPNFPVSTAPGHTGRMLFGRSHGCNVVVMNGRFQIGRAHV